MLKSITTSLAAIAVLAVVAGCAATPEAEPSAAPATPSPGGANRADPNLPSVDLHAASDEFDDAATLARWTVLQGDLITGQPSTFDIGATTAGALTVVAGRMSWVDRNRGLFLYHHVRGDFTVTVRIQATGRAAPVPAVDWSLAGLLLRAPATQTSAENWIGYTVGFVGVPTTERKTTRNGRSYLRLAPVDAGWIELRAVRLGSLIALLRRQDGKDWTFEGAYSRPDLPEIIQVGINAGTGIDPRPADLISTVDWIRFAPTIVPPAQLQQTLNRLARTARIQDGFGLSPSDTGLVKRDLLAYLTR